MCSYTNNLCLYTCFFVCIQTKICSYTNMKHVCIRAILFVYKRSRVRIQTNICLYTRNFASLQTCVYVHISSYTYNFDCLYTNLYIVRIQTTFGLYTNNFFLYTNLTDVLYTNRLLFVYKHVHVCIRAILPLYKVFLYVEKVFVYKHVKVCLRAFWLLYKVVPLRGETPC